MMRDPITLLYHEAKRNAYLSNLLNRVGELSDQEIEEATFPLPWYRKALKTLRDTKLSEARINSVLSKGKIIDTPSHRHMEIGSVVRYEGETFFHPASSPFEVRSGELIFVVSDGVWLGEKFVANPDMRLRQGRVLGKMARKDYIAEKNKYVLQQYGLTNLDVSHSNDYRSVVTTNGIRVNIRKY